MLIHRLVGGTIFLLLTLHAHAQQDAPVEVTPAMQEKIMAQVKKDVRQQQGAIPSSQGDRIQFDFKADTAIVEQFESKWITLDYSDFGMRDAAYAAADLYDSLLNKYYNMLLATLKGQDKRTLVQAQKAWLAFRDAEFKLVETISEEKYAGGGTLQQLTEASSYLDLVRKRTIDIFHHYQRAVNK